MPKTKFQSLIFTAVTVFCMVYCMTVYTIASNAGELTYSVFAAAIKEMWVEFIVVFLLIFFVITKAAQKLAFKFVTPGEDKPAFVILAIQCCTVCLIVPCITLFAAVFHNGFTAEIPMQWFALIGKCFPVALCLQIFLVGPFVRFVFRTVFKKQLAKE